MTDPCKNNGFSGSERGYSGGFSANQSKPWRHGEDSYNLSFCKSRFFSHGKQLESANTNEINRDIHLAYTLFR